MAEIHIVQRGLQTLKQHEIVQSNCTKLDEALNDLFGKGKWRMIGERSFMAAWGGWYVHGYVELAW